MYVSLKSSYRIVSLPEDFLTLKKVKGEDLTFELKYLFDQEVGIKQNITSVTVDVAKDTPPSVTNIPKPKDFVRSVLKHKSLHTQLINAYVKDSLLLSRASDPTKNVSNENVTYYNRGYVTSQIPQLLKRALVPVRVDEVTNPLTPVNAQHDVSVTGETEQQLAEDLLMRGCDPSSAYNINDLGTTLAEAYRGVLKRSPTVFESAAVKAMYKYKTQPFLKPILQVSPGDPGLVVNEDAIPDLYTLQRATVDTRYVDVKDTLKFTYSANSPDRLVLTLKVKDSAGVTVQQLSRVFYPREYIKYFNVPVKPPVVKLSTRSNKMFATLAIRQVDPAAARVRVYKRVYNHHDVSDEPYVFVSEFDLEVANGWKYIPVEVSLGNTIIYRVVPVNALGAIGADFESVVVKPQNRNATIKRVVVTTKSLTNGVQLDVSKLPSDAVSFQMLREDITLNRGTLTFVKTPVFVETADPNRVYTLEDTGVKPNHVYAYHCRIYRRSGSHEQRLVAHYEHIPLVENLVETKITDPTLVLTSTGYDVKFNITTTVVKTNLDQVKELLTKQGLYDVFANDVAEVREQLGKLISHNIKRVDLTTGAVEDFGTVDTDTFSDLSLRNVTGVSELRLGRKYRYIVTALLRAPETLLDTYVKTAIDATTNRLYSYKPFKFLHPVVSKHGNIVTPSSIRKNYSKDPMTFGEIGAYTTAEITLDKEKSIITTAVREKRGSDVDVISWVLQGSSKDVDHFQIITEHGGKKTVVGKATCIPETDNFLYVRRLDQTEVGLDIRYYVCPVYYDFTRGVEALVSNTGESGT